MAKIDIDRLSEAELVDLNHRLVERLRFLQQMRARVPRCWNSALATVFAFTPEATVWLKG